MKRAAAVLGILAAISGLAAILFVLFGPTYSTGTCDSNGVCTTGTASLIQVGLAPVTAMFFAFMVMLLVAVACAGLLVATGRTLAGLVILIVGFVFLVGATVGTFAFGPAIVPTDLLTFAAVIAAARASRKPSSRAGVTPR
ncbi:MAG TPA: hypothetical protein VF383_13980 [Candidatus Dormibacteraeota bacterium]